MPSTYEQGWIVSPRTTEDNEAIESSSKELARPKKNSLAILSEVALATHMASILFKAGRRSCKPSGNASPTESDSEASSDAETDTTRREKRRMARLERWASGASMKLTREFANIAADEP